MVLQKLAPSLILSSAIFLVVSNILGSGVFKKVAMMSATLQSPLLVLLCWVLAGFISLAGALCTAEMVGMFPNSGGEYFYFQKVYNRFFAFIYGWANFVVLKTAAIAALAYIFAQSFNSIFPLPIWTIGLGKGKFILIENVSIKLLASLLILFLSYINYRGVKHAEKLTRVMTIVMLVSVTIIIMAGLTSSLGSFHNLITPTEKVANGVSSWTLIKAITIASLGAFWGFEGWNCIGFLGEEVKNPKRNLPLALGIGTLLIMVLYVLLNLVYIYILPIEELIKINDHPNQIAAVVVMKQIWGAKGELFIALLILVTTFNATNGTILTSSRIFYAMARDNHFYKKAEKIHPVYKTPSVSLFLQASWSVILVWSGTFDQLTDMLIFSAFIFYGASALAVMIMRKRAPQFPRSYKVIGYPLTPFLFCIFCVLLIGVTLSNQPKEALSGLGLIALGIPFYFFWNKRTK
jgi:APA family basic amino acid/polyamine antiporter